MYNLCLVFFRATYIIISYFMQEMLAETSFHIMSEVRDKNKCRTINITKMYSWYYNILYIEKGSIIFLNNHDVSNHHGNTA